MFSGEVDTHDVIIPPHLRYRPPTVSNYFGQVEARYMSPSRSFVHTKPQYGFKPQINTNAEYANVPPRYNSPRRTGSPQKAAAKPLTRQTSYFASEEYQRHKTTAAALGIAQNTVSKYFDLHKTAPDTRVESPRHKAEQHVKELHPKKNGQVFNSYKKPAESFARAAEENPRLPRWTSPPKSSSTRVSKVIEYIHGQPNDLLPLPTQRPIPDTGIGARPFNGAGGAGGGVFQRTATSPVRQSFVLATQKAERVTTAISAARAKSPPRVAQLASRPSQEAEVSRPRTNSPFRRSNTTSSMAGRQQQLTTPSTNGRGPQRGVRSPPRRGSPEPMAVNGGDAGDAVIFSVPRDIHVIPGTGSYRREFARAPSPMVFEPGPAPRIGDSHN